MKAMTRLGGAAGVLILLLWLWRLLRLGRREQRGPLTLANQQRTHVMAHIDLATNTVTLDLLSLIEALRRDPGLAAPYAQRAITMLSRRWAQSPPTMIAVGNHLLADLEALAGLPPRRAPLSAAEMAALANADDKTFASIVWGLAD